jgi:hypothetical protein
MFATAGQPPDLEIAVSVGAESGRRAFRLDRARIFSKAARCVPKQALAIGRAGAERICMTLTIPCKEALRGITRGGQHETTLTNASTKLCTVTRQESSDPPLSLKPELCGSPKRPRIRRKALTHGAPTAVPGGRPTGSKSVQIRGPEAFGTGGESPRMFGVRGPEGWHVLRQRAILRSTKPGAIASANVGVSGSIRGRRPRQCKSTKGRRRLLCGAYHGYDQGPCRSDTHSRPWMGKRRGHALPTQSSVRILGPGRSNYKIRAP